MRRQVGVGPVPARRRGLRVFAAAVLFASLLSGLGGSPDLARAAQPYCEGATAEECLPAPAECATGRFNGHWEVRRNGRFAFVDCVGYVDPTGQRHIAHYEGGSLDPLCGLVVENDHLVVGGSWQDPNRCLVAQPEQGEAVKGTRYRDAVRGTGGVVASVSEAASKAGLDMLRAGGNAVDAAVAAVFAVGVTNPETCGIGGGGFLVARMADGRVRALDFRETAPKAMTPNSLSVKGINQWGTGHRVVGVPGTVAGMAEALRELGTKPLAETISGAEALARNGPEVAMSTANEYILSGGKNGGPDNETRLKLFPEAARIYLHNGRGYFPGAFLKQSDYARSLRLVVKYGTEAFYGTKTYLEGKSIGALIVEEMERSRALPLATRDDPTGEGDRSLMTADDLAAYRPVWRKPLRGTYRGYDLLSVPPPNAGGIQVQEILNIVEALDLTGMAHSSADRFHVLVEAQKLARADRDKYVADPDFKDVPTAQLTSDGYAAKRAAEIDMSEAKNFQAGAIPGYKPNTSTTAGTEGGSTTHVSVIDHAGNAVAVTCTLEQAFGSAVVALGTGFLLNNQLNDFSAPGTVNEPAGGKRPRSNTAPTIVVRDGRPVLVLGGMGGPTIPMGVVHVVTNVVDFGMDVAHAIDAARVYASDAAEGLPPLVIEDARLPHDRVVKALTDPPPGGKGHPKETLPGQPDAPIEYWPVPIMQVAGDVGGTRVAVSDSRSDYGAGAEAR